MALLSPGVEITIIDESFYESSTPGSIPLIVIATAEDKAAPSGSGLAPMTLKSKAGKLFQASGQRDAIQAFGNPIFYGSGGAAIHGYELNEYGLHAAYSYLGVSNSAFILRADIDTAALIPNATQPSGLPNDGTYWFDTAATAYGLFQSNGNAVPGHAWVSKQVLVATDEDTTSGTVDSVSMKVPQSNFGSNGDFAIVIENTNNFMFEKLSGNWFKVGSAGWKSAHPTKVTGKVSPDPVTVSSAFSINNVTVTATGTNLATIVSDINNALSLASINDINAAAPNGALEITHTAGGNLDIDNESGTPLTALGITPKLYKGVTVSYTNNASYPAGSIVGDLWIKGSSTNNGADFVLKVYNATSASWERVAVKFYPFNSTVSDGTSGKDAAALAAGLTSLGSIYVAYDATNGVIQFRRHNGANFVALSYEASDNSPTTVAAAGTLWYSTDFRVDIMVSDGTNYRGYLNVYPDTNPGGVFLSGSAPTVQSDGTALVNNDLWINTTELDAFPRIRRYDATTQRWQLIDNTDQTSPFGIVFADARADSGTAFTGQVVTGYAYNSEQAEDLLESDFLDPDAPDARTVPAGMLLFNTRYSTYNVKKWVPDHFSMGVFDEDTNYGTTTYTVGGQGYTFPALSANVGRWVTVSGNDQDGSPFMGRRAQRAVIVRAMAAALAASEEARSEIINFNLIAAPGYPELLDEMISLNADQKNTAFIVADTPARLQPNAQAVSAWAQNHYGAASNGDKGLTSKSPYAGLYYPWGLSTNIDGTEVMVPPSTMALRVIAYNDQVAYPWFAPAGFQRGLVTNASSVGYLTEEGEYRTALLSEGMRNALYTNSINPITFIPGRGLVVFGQKTLSPVSTSLDRINVARLCNYLVTALDALTKPFLFQQNDQQTRDGLKSAVDRFLGGLVGLRAIDDFVTICDTSINTRDRINRNELWCEVAILPTKSLEFIFVPIRLTDDVIE